MHYARADLTQFERVTIVSTVCARTPFFYINKNAPNSNKLKVNLKRCLTPLNDV